MKEQSFRGQDDNQTDEYDDPEYGQITEEKMLDIAEEIFNVIA